MGIQITVYGSTQFDVNYEDSEIRSMIDSYIAELKSRDVFYFTYYTLCNRILRTAQKDKCLVGFDANTYYESPQLSQKEYTRISRILWDFIREGVLFVDFSNNKYIARYESDTTLGITDK